MIGRISDRATFTALRRDGIRIRQGPLTIVHLATGSPGPAAADAVEATDVTDATDATEAAGAARRPRVRVAYAIGTKVGTAVTRNRLRRRLRAVFAETDPAAIAAGAYLVSAGPEAASLSYQELREHVERGLQRINAKAGRR